MMNPSSPTEEEEEEEEWVFSLHLPFADQKLVQLITSHHAMKQQQHQQQRQGSLMSSEEEDEDESPPPPETKSLLDHDDEDDDGITGTCTTTAAGTTTPGEDCCWKYTSPLGRTLKSSSLLQLSYRPAWQGIPEYTRTQRQRTLARMCGCCCPSNSTTNEEEVPEQISEVYTTQNIVKTHRRIISIRGMGKCQAVQVYLKPFYNDHDEMTGRASGSMTMTPPATFQSALSDHRQRMGQPSAYESEGSRYTEPNDSLQPSKDDDTNNTNNDNTMESRFIVVTFAVPIETELKYDPPLLWKVDLPRHPAGIMLDTITVLDGSVDLKEPATHVYIQGYQSWSFTGSVWKGHPQPKSALPDLYTRAFNFGGAVPKPPTLKIPVVSPNSKSCTNNTINPNNNNNNPAFKRNYYKSDFFTCITTGRGEIMDESGGPALLCGWISQHEQFGVVTMDDRLQGITMHASHHAQMNHGTISTDWAYGQLISPHHYDEEPMVHFLRAAAAYNQANPLQNGPLLTGWCSWYHYYENISAANLRNNFAKLASMKHKVPTYVAIVDDGYMTAWGDWDSLKPGKFTDMAIVCRDIVSHGMRPGVWLAPFACDKHSTIVKRHPEWIIRNDRGRPANSSNCGKFFYGLDATNPHVREHAFESIRRAVHDWGFQVLKIDFLYAACLEGNGKYDMSMTRAQAMHLALHTIRDAAGPDVFLVGCGCPIGSGIGYVDGMRISADTGPTWYPGFPLPRWDHGTLPSLRAMIRNSMSRAPMGHRWWHNDPDCLLLGETTSLTNEEVASAASIVAMTCGMMLLSDDLTKVSIARMRILNKIFPLTGATAVVLDLHTTNNKGLPSILRLWCTDKYNSLEEYRESAGFQQSRSDENHNAEATHFGRQASFSLVGASSHPNERKRSCIHVARGLGTWTVISLSNWADTTQLMHIPRLAVEPAPKTGWGASGRDTEEDKNCDDGGYHVFSFWSGLYSWMSLKDCENDSSTSKGQLSRHLGPHETKIFHIRPVTLGVPQYVGSDLHFSCGHEVLAFDVASRNQVRIQLKTDLNRVGHIFLFVPTVDTCHVKVSVGGISLPDGRWAVVGNVPREGHCCGRILRIMVVVHSNGSDQDGEIQVEY
jgi:hypothetical protein